MVFRHSYNHLWKRALVHEGPSRSAKGQSLLVVLSVNIRWLQSDPGRDTGMALQCSTNSEKFPQKIGLVAMQLIIYGNKTTAKAVKYQVTAAWT